MPKPQESKDVYALYYPENDPESDTEEAGEEVVILAVKGLIKNDPSKIQQAYENTRQI
jgi:hypothetical protein